MLPHHCFGILHSLNSTAVNGDVFVKNLQGGTFAFEHLYLQILDSHIPYEVFCGHQILHIHIKIQLNQSNLGSK
jgi:hypothetical protein